MKFKWFKGLGGSVVKNPPTMQEKSAQSVGWEDPLEKEW